MLSIPQEYFTLCDNEASRHCPFLIILIMALLAKEMLDGIGTKVWEQVNE